MSRLESFIRRLTAQRDILDQVCVEVAKIEGPVIELGLGNGRTFHHLRERLPGRRIVAFDRALAAHSSSIPEPENLVLAVSRISPSTR
ncbi:class I SAM-dependent methyltransferase, partial [Mesorhizobium sp. M2E.F.Ca.ET.154.01.1.1]|uniref:class I SAM-dependent methyltransferase n=1 Tax=Mesorhizobium sp. M2E.F.Ca.ET.154.01.1.1 TaxID=2500521 RepID=UPI00127F6046